MPIKVIPLSYKQDSRGFDVLGLQKSDVFNGKSIEDICIHSVNPGEERGGHYHKIKTEWLLPLSGSASFLWTDKQQPRQDDLEVVPVVAGFQNLCVLEIPPMVSHWLKNNSAQVFVMASFSSHDYNALIPDTFKQTFV
ncbi:MAG: WxcM-like domain-containing protein [Candidatus Bathyarchaeota archaeon]|nr:WxcM-like domain-containing protein [Candidatus Bathyarchaeota archaeon]